MYFEEFMPGQVFKLAPVTLTAEEIEAFATQYDPQRIHVDKAFAESGFYRGVIASGLHTLNAVWKVWIDLGAFGDEVIGGRGLDYVTWDAPVRPGDTLETTVEVMETSPSRSGRHGEVALRFTSVNQEGTKVCSTQARGLLRAKFPGSETGYVEVEGGRIWYRIVGKGKGTPLVTLHGGPGGSHGGFEPLALALQADRPVILYDQLGSGLSDRPDDKALWTTERFVRELATLRAALGLDEVHLLGQSWGTMLLADYLLTQPTGVKSATFSSPCLSVKRWVADADRYREDLPKDVQETLLRCEREGTTDSPEYEQATEVYMKRHVNRVPSDPLQKTRRDAAFGKTVYNTMWGPSEFHPTGTLKTYDRTDRLHEIRVPALFTCGRYDEAAPGSTEYYHSLVPGSTFQIFENSSHSALREEPEAYISTVRAFLAKHD